MNRPGRPSKRNDNKGWVADFTLQVQHSELYGKPDINELNKILVKKLEREYTRGYQAAKRPFKKYMCSWCGKYMEENVGIHPGCSIIKEEVRSK